MSMEIQGLTEFQKDLLTVAQKRLPKETNKIMMKIGNKARARVAKNAKKLAGEKTGYYKKKWKRGKVFRGSNGEIVTRVYNSSPHAHLIEDGHRMVTEDGREVGFVHGKKVLEKSMQEFDASGEKEKMLSDWLDEQLRAGGL